MKDPLFSKNAASRLFWDVDFEGIDRERDRRLILERIFSLGNIDEIRAAISYYGRAKIAETLIMLEYLDPKTLNFVSILFDIPKQKFKCYTKKRSIRQHWNS